MPQMDRTQLKTGQRPVQLNTRTLKPGEILFEEGSQGRELFIIQSGRVGVYKDTPEGRIELATIEKGGIVGEMSLLDNLPRSATIEALEETRALIVNESVFQAALQKAPIWLTSIVKIVVSRLRDTNKRVDQCALRDRERGLVLLMLLLLPSSKYEFGSRLALSYDLLLVEAYFVCRLKKKEIQKLINSLIRRGLVDVEEDTNGKQHICLTDPEAIRLFEEYCRLKSEKKKFREATIPEDAVATLGNIAYVAQKAGRQTEEGMVLLKSALLEDLSDKKLDILEKNLLELRRRGLINVIPDAQDMAIVFKTDMLSRIKKIKEWLPRFEMEIA